jgi:3-dehydroquinate synthase
MKMKRITVQSAGGHYAVLYGRGGLRSGLRRARAGGSGTYVVSSRTVWRHCGGAVRRALGGKVPVLLFGDAERAKSLRTVEQLCRKLSRAGADRESVIVAVGGGVVGDVAGFVAASYLRGVRLVHVPTTLVAQVDSAIGGKTGVNLPEGKNLMGAFYAPELVVADPGLLRTLPQRQYRSGIYEVIKYGVILDGGLFGYLEKHLDALLARRPRALDAVIPRCIAAKARVVSADEREGGQRELLNYGHTVGHALETVTRYRRYLHGEAVGLGMQAACLLAVAKKKLSQEAAERIVRLVERVGPMPAWPAGRGAELLRAMRGDKKSRGGRLRFVLPTRIGRGEWGVTVRERELF